MNSTDKLMKCIICQENINSSINDLCVKGHIHCNACAINLDGACGLCSEPIGPFQESCETMLLQGLDTKQTSSEENQAQAESLTRIEMCEQCVNMKLDFETENCEPTEESESQDVNKLEPQIETLTNDVVNTGLHDTLKALHRTMCERKCTTFDSCIRKLLLKIIEQSSLGISNMNIQSTQSLDDLLETLHINLCELDCDDIELCLNAQLENVMKLEESKYKERKTLKKQLKVDIENEDGTNVVRSCYKAFKSKPAKAQFQYLTDRELPKSYKSIMPNEFDHNLAFVTETAQTQCPLINCKLQLNRFDALAHMQEQHRNLILEPMSIGECKTFFIDPSILESNEVECLLCFVISSTINVPIFVMVCRSALSKLYADDEYGTKKSMEESFRIFEEEAVIEAEIAEAIYGTKKNVKNKPVKWTNEDVLIVWPIAPIPFNENFKTVLNVFMHNKQNCHRSISFPMRTMQHSRKPLDVFGSPDALWLTNVEIDELTNHGEHVIQCQIACRI